MPFGGLTWVSLGTTGYFWSCMAHSKALAVSAVLFAAKGIIQL